MSAKDVFQTLEEADDQTVASIVERLEMRGRDVEFVAMRDRYVERLQLGPTAQVLELGCGTGVVARAIAGRPGFEGRVVGSDYSAALIDAAQRFAAEDGVGDRTRFVVEDAQRTEQPDRHFDAVLLHTLVSHVPDPAATIGEAARTVKLGHPVAVFDGDYASLAMFTGHDGDDAVVEAILQAVVANPTVMRTMPTLLGNAGLHVVDLEASTRIETGELVFFRSLAEAYLPIAVRVDLLDESLARDWQRSLDTACAGGTAFASCNYIAYVARRADL